MASVHDWHRLTEDRRLFLPLTSKRKWRNQPRYSSNNQLHKHDCYLYTQAYVISNLVSIRPEKGEKALKRSGSVAREVISTRTSSASLHEKGWSGCFLFSSMCRETYTSEFIPEQTNFDHRYHRCVRGRRQGEEQHEITDIHREEQGN